MKVALVLEALDPRRGGLEHWTFQFCRHVISAGHEVHILAGDVSDVCREMPIVLHHLPQGRSRVETADLAAAQLQSLEVDIIHDMGVGWYCDVLHPHGGTRRALYQQSLRFWPSWFQPIKRWIDNRLPRHKDFSALLDNQFADDGKRIIALSHMVAGHLRKFHQVQEDRVRLIYNGVDTERFSPQHCAVHRRTTRVQLGVQDKVVLLMVAHNLQLKGAETVIRALSRLRDGDLDVHFLVVGGKHPRPFQRLAARLGVAQMVSFVDAVEDPLPFYAAADIYAQPTFYDPCSLVVLEALACGLPVITSRFNGAAELMHPGREGFVLDDPADATELGRLATALGDIERRRMMGAAARRLAEQHTFARNAAEILQLYEEILADRRPLQAPFYPHPSSRAA